MLNDRGLLLRNYTQNIDTLEVVCGIPEEKLVFAHGSFATAHCVSCKKEFTKEFVRDEAFEERIPKCDCGGIVKPDITFFGESLPPRFFKQLPEDFPKCDLLIVMGTSLAVRPFADILHSVNLKVPRFLFNRESVSVFTRINYEYAERRDFQFLGDCDSAVLRLAKLIGWEEQLLTNHKLSHEELDKKKEQFNKKIGNL